MKKVILLAISAMLIVSLSATVFAALTGYFTDEATFATWFAPAARKMKTAGVINGYADGSFGASKNVNRAELAVMLDKFATAMGKPLSEDGICTLQYQNGLSIILQDQNGTPITGAKISAKQNYDGTGIVSGDTSFHTDSENGGTYSGIGEGKGYYTMTIKKAGYADHIETIKLEQDGCHVITQTKTITLAIKLPQ